jgi:hypothetical protein
LEEEAPASFGWAVPSEMVARTGAGVDAEGSGANTGVVPRLLVLLVVVEVVVAGGAPTSPFMISVAFTGLTLSD